MSEANESELRDKTVDELREMAKKAGVSGAFDMKKDELVSALASSSGRDEDGDRGGRNRDDKDRDGRDRDDRDSNGGSSGDVGAGPDDGRVRTGKGSSDSLKYSQEVTSPDDEPEREGRSLVTTHHEVIKQWAEERDARPATVPGTEHGDHLGVLRFDFGGGTDGLREVGWDEWFDTFDSRRLNFIYQEQRSDGSQSNFFQLENPDREDA